MPSNPSMFKVFINSFFMQASWSFEKMQSLGFVAAISPALREIYKDDSEGMELALKRHLAFYNAHPYMASPILGAAIRLEEMGKDGVCPVDSAVRLRTRLMAPLSALGDSFYWASIRPFASCAGIAAALMSPNAWLGPLLFLVVYNCFHLWMRWRGLERGYGLGEGVGGYVKSLELPRTGLKLRYAACGLLGLVAAWTAAVVSPERLSDARHAWFHGHLLTGFILPVLSVIAFVFFFLVLLRRGVSVARVFYVIAPVLTLLGVLIA